MLTITWKSLNSSVSAIIFFETALIQSWTALISSKTALMIGVLKTTFSNYFLVFLKFRKLHHFRGILFWSSTQLAKWNRLHVGSCSIILAAKNSTKYRILVFLLLLKLQNRCFNFSKASFCSALKTQCLRATKIGTEQLWFRGVSFWNRAHPRWKFHF